MTPDLEAFFAAQARFFASAADPAAAAAALAAEFPGWRPRPARLVVYAEAVAGHVRATLEQTLPATRAAVDADRWAALVARHRARRPASAPASGALAADFAGTLDAALADLDLPAFLPALARLEWALVAAYTAPDAPAPDRAAVNPTLDALEHPWRLCAYLDAPAPRAAPAAGDEVALVWRHPATLRVHHRPADARALLAVKVVAEGIDPVAAAAAGGVSAAQVRAALDDAVRDGLVVARSS